mgnify:CR=1 FL=1
MAHITGGGITDNLPRILPPGTAARVNRTSWRVPAIFRWIGEAGRVPEYDLRRALNMGIGLILVVAAKDADAVRNELLGRAVVERLHDRRRGRGLLRIECAEDGRGRVGVVVGVEGVAVGDRGGVRVGAGHRQLSVDRLAAGVGQGDRAGGSHRLRIDAQKAGIIADHRLHARQGRGRCKLAPDRLPSRTMALRSGPSLATVTRTGSHWPALNEPPKSEVLAWSPGKSFRREAFANVYDRAKTKLFEVIVDSCETIKGGLLQSAQLSDERLEVPGLACDTE